MPSADGPSWYPREQLPAGPPRPQAPPASFPPRIEYHELRDVPEPLRSVLATAVLPLDFAITALKIVKDVEELLAELTNHLRALRPAVAGLSEAYARGHFDAAFRTLDQIQHGANALASAWAPINAVVPRPIRAAIPVAVPTYRPPAYPVPAYAAPVPPAPVPPAPARPAPPSTAEWLGGIGTSVLNQAEALPGGGLLVRRLRRTEGAPSEAAAAPGAPDPAGSGAAERVAPAAARTPTLALPMIGQAGAVLPGPLKRLLGAT